MARIFGKLKEFMTGEYDEYDEEEYDETYLEFKNTYLSKKN